MNVWIYGPAGIGKTGWVVDYFKDNGGHFKKDKSKYWNNYANEPNVLINDLEKGEEFMLAKLKEWGEHQPFQAEDKYGGYRQIRPMRIAVTSNYAPKDLWPNDTELAPIKRRFKIVKMAAQYWPEGSKGYNPEYRANALYPGHRQNNPLQQVVEEAEADVEASDFSIDI